MSLPTIPNISKLSPTITRILGQNPGKFTLQGTNTYLIGHPSSLLLIDTGSAETESNYIPLLKQELQKEGASLKHVILTHWHGDHVGGLDGVLNLTNELQIDKPTIWKLPDPVKDKEQGLTGKGIRDLSEGQEFQVADSNRLKIISTPGHTDDSISLFLDSDPPVLFTADTVLGHGTAVFEDLGVYMRTLEKCIGFLGEVEGGKRVRLYPGHGEVVEDGLAKFEEYRKHRLEREEQVVQALKQNASGGSGSNSEGGLTPEEWVKVIYADTIPESLVPAAARGIILHLRKLVGDGKVEKVGGAGQGGVASLEEDWSRKWRLLKETASEVEAKM